jgi:hypothetical protein
MAKAKQTQPEPKEPKQIVLTQEQFDKLIEIYQTLDNATDEISKLADGEFHDIQLGYNLGMINSGLERAYNALDELTDAIDPNRDSWWSNDAEETDESK